MKKLPEKSSHFVNKLHKSWLHMEGVSEGFTYLQSYVFQKLSQNS